MKIIYIVNARIPTEKAHGYQICKMCEEFACAEVETELWAPTRKNPIKQNTYDYYNFRPNYKIEYIKAADFIEYVKFFGKIAVYLQLLWFLFKLFIKKIDKKTIIYTRNPEIVWLFKLKGFKVAYECHDWFGKNKKIALFFLKNCDYVISTNNYIKNEFVKHGFTDERLLVAPNGIDLSIFDLNIDKEEALKKINISDEEREKIRNKRILLYTGSFRTMGVDKGIDEILKALKMINNKDLIFIAVGGSDKDIGYYESMAKDLTVTDNTIFIGRRPQAELALWQKTADILLMPFPDKAHYRYFMTPLKIFEYMASGRPIIASDLPSIREILNNKNCLFNKPGDVSDLADKIIYAIEQANKMKNKASQAYNEINNYTWGKRANKIINFIKQKP